MMQNLELKNKIRILSVLGFITYSFLIFLYWPGLLDFDILNSLPAFVHGEAQPWSSYTYSYLVILLFKIYAHPGLVMFFWALSFSTIFHLFFSYLIVQKGLGVWYYLIFLFIFNFWPYFIINNLLLSRDILSGILVSALISYLLVCGDKGRSWSRFHRAEATVIAILTVVAGEVRQDARATWILFPLALFLCVRLSPLYKKWYLSVILLMSIIAAIILPLCTEGRLTDPLHTATGLMNPLQEIIKNHGDEKLSLSDQALLRNFIDVDWVHNTELTHDNIWMLHLGKVNKEAISQRSQDFFDVSLKLLFTNPGVFIHNRWNLISSYLGFNEFQIYLLDEATQLQSEVAKNLEQYTFALRPHEDSQSRQVFNLSVSGLAQWMPLRVLFLSLVPFIVLLLLLLWKLRTSRHVIWALIICWYRILPLFLFAPGAYSKYAYGIYLGTFLVFFYGLSHKIFLKNGKNKSCLSLVPRGV